MNKIIITLCVFFIFVTGCKTSLTNENANGAKEFYATSIKKINSFLKEDNYTKESFFAVSNMESLSSHFEKKNRSKHKAFKNLSNVYVEEFSRLWIIESNNRMGKLDDLNSMLESKNQKKLNLFKKELDIIRDDLKEVGNKGRYSGAAHQLYLYYSDFNELVYLKIQSKINNFSLLQVEKKQCLKLLETQNVTTEFLSKEVISLEPRTNLIIRTTDFFTLICNGLKRGSDVTVVKPSTLKYIKNLDTALYKFKKLKSGQYTLDETYANGKKIELNQYEKFNALEFLLSK